MGECTCPEGTKSTHCAIHGSCTCCHGATCPTHDEPERIESKRERCHVKSPWGGQCQLDKGHASDAVGDGHAYPFPDIDDDSFWDMPMGGRPRKAK